MTRIAQLAALCIAGISCQALADSTDYLRYRTLAECRKNIHWGQISEITWEEKNGPLPEVTLALKNTDTSISVADVLNIQCLLSAGDKESAQSIGFKVRKITHIADAYPYTHTHAQYPSVNPKTPLDPAKLMTIFKRWETLKVCKFVAFNKGDIEWTSNSSKPRYILSSRKIQDLEGAKDIPIHFFERAECVLTSGDQSRSIDYDIALGNRVIGTYTARKLTFH